LAWCDPRARTPASPTARAQSGNIRGACGLQPWILKCTDENQGKPEKESFWTATRRELAGENATKPGFYTLRLKQASPCPPIKQRRARRERATWVRCATQCIRQCQA